MPNVQLPVPAIALARARVPALSQEVFPTGIASSAAVGAPRVGIEQFLGAVAIASSGGFGLPDVLHTGQTLSPTGIGSSAAFGVLTAGQFASQYVSAAGAIASSGAFGLAAASLSGPGTISPVGIPSAEAFG